MTPNILRAVLVVAFLFGVGIVANVFHDHDGAGSRAKTARLTSKPVLVKQGAEAKAETPEESARRIAGAVRRELELRGYLVKGNGVQVDPAMRAAILGAPSPSPVPVASFADGVANMKVMDAIRASAANGGELVKVEQA